MKPSPTIAHLTQRNVDAINQLTADSENSRTFGNRVADTVAATVGSWPFIIIQTVVLVIWMIVNVANSYFSWDNYPLLHEVARQIDEAEARRANNSEPA